MKMRTMSLYESGDSTGAVSLSDLFAAERKPMEGNSIIDINRLAYLICRGGWPGALDLEEEDALAQAYDYYDVVCDSDVSRADEVQRDPQKVRLLMRSYARHQGTMAAIGTILADLKANEASSLSDNTVYDYIKALKKIFVIEDMAAWNPNLRSKTGMKSPSFMMVLTGIGDFPYQRDDGVFVVPIGCLKA